MFRKIEAAMF